MSRKIGASELLTQLEAVRAATQRLMADIEAERAKNALLAASLRNQDEEVASLRGKNAEENRLRSESEDLRGGLELAESRIAELETERNEVVARNVQLIEELEAVKAQLQAAGAAAKNEIDALNRDLADTIAARDALNEQVVKLQAAVVGVRLTDEERAELTKQRKVAIEATCDAPKASKTKEKKR